ncbi:hypothetical protein C7974DRAFT_210302 [Boeremia exigua]|uniref:uncharacterized protein n=1 Tax=Boeremia exigua TaxID=749465 RepID=UPI001E8DCC06|nr:uncharacterized protein C7974DRAFT_210302 [Boeremia exigua]KAH6621746.1 hypothetical protein C7974DRAFT_210302 [Boeremia exigua]
MRHTLPSLPPTHPTMVPSRRRTTLSPALQTLSAPNQNPEPPNHGSCLEISCDLGMEYFKKRAVALLSLSSQHTRLQELALARNRHDHTTPHRTPPRHDTMASTSTPGAVNSSLVPKAHKSRPRSKPKPSNSRPAAKLLPRPNNIRNPYAPQYIDARTLHALTSLSAVCVTPAALGAAAAAFGKGCAAGAAGATSTSTSAPTTGATTAATTATTATRHSGVVSGTDGAPLLPAAATAAVSTRCMHIASRLIADLTGAALGGRAVVLLDGCDGRDGAGRAGVSCTTAPSGSSTFGSSSGRSSSSTSTPRQCPRAVPSIVLHPAPDCPPVISYETWLVLGCPVWSTTVGVGIGRRRGAREKARRREERRARRREKRKKAIKGENGECEDGGTRVSGDKEKRTPAAKRTPEAKSGPTAQEKRDGSAGGRASPLAVLRVFLAPDGGADVHGKINLDVKRGEKEKSIGQPGKSGGKVEAGRRGCGCGCGWGVWSGWCRGRIMLGMRARGGGGAGECCAA